MSVGDVVRINGDRIGTIFREYSSGWYQVRLGSGEVVGAYGEDLERAEEFCDSCSAPIFPDGHRYRNYQRVRCAPCWEKRLTNLKMGG